jgi:hypothetical protein
MFLADVDGRTKPLEANELVSTTEIVVQTCHADMEANARREEGCLMVEVQPSCLKSHPVGQPVRVDAAHGTVRHDRLVGTRQAGEIVKCGCRGRQSYFRQCIRLPAKAFGGKSCEIKMIDASDARQPGTERFVRVREVHTGTPASSAIESKGEFVMFNKLFWSMRSLPERIASTARVLAFSIVLPM